MGRIMAFDYGLKRVGVAVTDPLKIFPSGLDTIETPKIFEFITNYLNTELVEQFVVGEPLNLDGSDTHATEPVRKFVKKLKKIFPTIPIDLEDESFTSQQAMQVMIQAGVKKKKRRNKALLDKVSATLILKSYLERL
ncbi:MAG: Holliday junction resolvase RuvX [Chitinophagales bacterium]